MKASESQREYSTFHLFLIALAGLVLLFIVAPLAGLVLHSSGTEIRDAAQDDEVRRSIWLTICTAMAATALMSIPAVPLAYLLARNRIPGTGLINAIIDLPVVIPHAAAGIALLTLLSESSLVGRTFASAGISFVSTLLGVVTAMAFVSVPFLINSARDGFAAVPEQLERTALNLGASPSRVFFTVSMPLASRSIASGAVLMWARGMSEFGAVVFIAYQPMIAPVLIWERFGAFGLAYARPIAVLLLAISLILFAIPRYLTTRGQDAQR